MNRGYKQTGVATRTDYERQDSLSVQLVANYCRPLVLIFFPNNFSTTNTNIYPHILIIHPDNQ